MDLNRSSPSIKGHREVSGLHENNCLFLGLPDELISLVFSFLPMRDRMRVRVNKRLNRIELESKYFVKNLLIKEEPRQTARSLRNDNKIVFFEDQSYSSDCVRKIAQNATIEYLIIYLSGSETFHRDVYYLSKNFNAKKLDLRFQSDQIEKQIVVDSFFLDVSRRFEILTIDRCVNITADALHQVYKSMMEGSTKLRKFYTPEANELHCDSFLSLIGITFKDGQFFSNRDIEVYSGRSDSRRLSPILFRIFDGSLEIVLSHLFDSEECDFGFTLHKTVESLEKAKNPRNCSLFTKFDVYPVQE